MSTVTEITSLDEFSSHLATLSPSTLLVLYFYTPWTAFSTKMGPGLSELASSYQNITPLPISFVSVNGKELTDLAKQFEIKTAPCVALLRDGQVLESIKGSDLSKIRDALNRNAGVNVGAAAVTAVTAVQALVFEESKAALKARLDGLIRSARVVLFMKGTPNSPRCRFSRRLVSILRENKIEFDSFDVLADEDVREGLKEYADWPTYPQLWVDGKLLGGLDVVREELDADPGFLSQSRPVLVQ